MPRPQLPLEIRGRVYVELNDPYLAEFIPEVFWAIGPHYFRDLTIGQLLNDQESALIMRLIERYPTSGSFVETLTIVTDQFSQTHIDHFLKKWPKERKLRHLTLQFPFKNQIYYHLYALRYANPLYELVDTSPDLTRLSFHHFQPSPDLITACSDRLTRLDIGYIHSVVPLYFFNLPPCLEILTFTPWAPSLFLGEPPETLHRILIRSEEYFDEHSWEDSADFIARCSSLVSLGLEDKCMFLYTFILPFAHLVI